MNLVRRSVPLAAFVPAIAAVCGAAACGGSSGAATSPTSGEKISCGALEYISDGQCVPLVIHGPWDAAAFVDTGDASPDVDASTLFDAGSATDDDDGATDASNGDGATGAAVDAANGDGATDAANLEDASGDGGD